MKERISLTLNKSVLAKLDKLVDKTQMRNRSHAVEILLTKALSMDIPKQAVILAGKHDEKSLRKINGKFLIDLIIEMLENQGVEQFFIIISKNSRLKDVVKQNEFIHLIEEEPLLGTGGALRLIKNRIKSPFIITNSDEYKDVDIRDMYEFHRKQSVIVTVGLTTSKDPCKYGVAKLKGTKIIDFSEKPENPETSLINAGIYIVEPELFEELPDGKVSLEREVFPVLAKKGELAGYHFEGEWNDI